MSNNTKTKIKPNKKLLNDYENVDEFLNVNDDPTFLSLMETIKNRPFIKKLIMQERINSINILSEHYQSIMDNKLDYINMLVKLNESDNGETVVDTNKQVKSQTKYEMVLEQIKYNNETYYKDSTGGILNDKAELIGIIKSQSPLKIEFFIVDDEEEKDINKLILNK